MRNHNKMEIIAYEMKYENDVIETDHGIECVLFDETYFQEYRNVYNECFYEMRKVLGVEPYNYLHDYGQIREKAEDIYLLIIEGEIVGSVACYGNEVDDLIVNKKFQHQGYGKKLLLWAMQKIRKESHEPITLHVAEWNQNALKLYRTVGFEISKKIKVR